MVEKTKCQIKWPSANITVRLNEGLRYIKSAHVVIYIEIDNYVKSDTYFKLIIKIII